MLYGIRYTVEFFDVFEDGSKRKRPTVNQGWQMNAWYNSMKAAKWEGAQGTIGGLRSLCDLTADTVSIIATWKREVAP